MNNFTKYSLKLLSVALIAFSVSGCTSLQESMASQMEVPTLERQANRVAIGMTIVRENNIMAFNMPISSDAQWPAEIAADLNDTQKQNISDILVKEPFYSTVHYSDIVQRKYLGSGVVMSSFGDYGNFAAHIMDQKISPMTYRAIQKIRIFYGEDPKNWPDVFNFDDTLDNFLTFKDGTMKDIEAPSGDVYENIGEAVVSLAPANLQKELDDARLEMMDAFLEVAELKREKAEYESELKLKKRELRSSDKLEVKQQIALLDTKIKESESFAEEKEAIYFTLIDSAIIALQSDINLDDSEYVKLAQNINIVSSQIQVGATEAYTSFALAMSNIIGSNILLKFPKELESLAIAKLRVPANLQSKYNKRVARLVKNAVYLLPNIAIGTYYASKQASLASKYKDITEVIILAYETKLEQDKEEKEAK